jgi:hypothetical protein
MNYQASKLRERLFIAYIQTCIWYTLNPTYTMGRRETHESLSRLLRSK